jgi:hypothetical protein
MHNCKEAKEQLTELLLDGDDRAEAMLDQCEECRAEFEALAATLRMTTRLRESVTSSESYWTSYHTQLRQRVSFHAQAQRLKHAKPQREDLKPGLGFFFASLRQPLRLCVKPFLVPVPLGVALLIVVGLLSLFLIRATPPPAPPIQTPVVVQVPVEVPVIKERTITQIVYRERRPQAKSAKRPVEPPPVVNTFAQFKPTDDVKLTVIKGGSTNEK